MSIEPTLTSTWASTSHGRKREKNGRAKKICGPIARKFFWNPSARMQRETETVAKRERSRNGNGRESETEFGFKYLGI